MMLNLQLIGFATFVTLSLRTFMSGLSVAVTSNLSGLLFSIKNHAMITN